MIRLCARHRYWTYFAPFFLLLGFLFMQSSIAADNPQTVVQKDPQIEARLKVLSSELRCLVCQNTTLADSDAPLAEDLRNEIRTLMQAGKSDEAITAYLVARYGNFVRYRPPVNSETALLWFGPFIMLLIGAFVLFRVLKKRATAGIEPAAASDDAN